MLINSSSPRFALVALAIVALMSGCDYFVSPATRVERARSHIEEANYRAALVELKNALQKEPGIHHARLLLAEVALWLGDPSSADVELQRVPGTLAPVEIAELQTRIDLALGRSKQVLERLTASAELFDPAMLEYYRGRALMATGDPKAAQAAFELANEKRSSLLAAQIGLVESLAAQGESSRANALIETLVEAQPDSALVWFTRGSLLVRSDTNEALQSMARAQSLASKQLDVRQQVELLSNLSELQLAVGNVEQARDSSAKLSRLAPGSPIAAVVSSRIAMASNDYAAAAAELRRVVNGAPQFVQARFMLGIALSAQGHLEQASHELGQVVKQAPHIIEARQLLARVRMRLDDPDGALRVLVPALESGNEVVGVSALIDAARTQVGSSRTTIELLEQELAKSPNNTGLAVQLASAYLEGEEPTKALTLLRRLSDAEMDARREGLHLQSLLKVEGELAARKRAESLLAAHASDPQVVSMTAAFFTSVGDIETGRKHLTEALAREGDSVGMLLTLAQLEWAARRPAAARQALQRLLRLNQEHVRARLALAELELATGNKQAAKVELERLRSADKNAAGPRLQLARLALNDNAADEAAALVAEALEGDVNELEVRAAAGSIYLGHGRYDQAIQHLRAGVQLDPGAAPVWLNLGRAQLALNQHVEARESFEQALEMRPKWIAPQGALAFLDLQLGDREAAVSRLSALQKQRPKDPAVLALRGHVHMSLREYEQAANAFDAANEMQMTNSNVVSAYQARLAGNLPRPEEPLERWIRQHPEDLNLRNLLADAHTRNGERHKAIQQYEYILDRRPRHPASLNNLAWLYYELKDGRAIEIARRASAAAPSSPAVSDTLGWILVEAGRTEEGLKLLEKASTQAKASPEIAYHYAAALVRSGAVVEGRSHLERILKDYPSFPSRRAAEQLLTGAPSARPAVDSKL